MKTNDTPLTSVIIPTYNRLSYLSKCLESIKNTIETESLNYEVIVVDAGSTDGTVNFLDTFDAPWLRWISEKDNGAAEAVNKGISLSRGKFFRYFSDDDQMVPGCNALIVQYLIDNPDIDVAAGVAQYNEEDCNGTITPIEVNQTIGELSYKSFGDDSGWLTHEATTIRKKIFTELGYYDTRIRHSFDVELWWRILKARKRFVVLNHLLVIRHLQPNSNSRTHDKEIFKEFTLIYSRHHAWKLLYWLYWHSRIHPRLDKSLVTIKKRIGLMK